MTRWRLVVGLALGVGLLAGCPPPLTGRRCAADADCPRDHRCEAAWQLCVPVRTEPPPPAPCGGMGAIRDDFDQLDAARGFGQFCPAVVQQGVLLFEAESGSSRAWPLCQAQFGASLVGDSLSLEIVQPPARADSQVFFGVFDRPAALDLFVEFALVDGMLALAASPEVGAVVGEPVAFDAAIHHRWRLREQAGTLIAETSPGGSTWVELGRLPAPAYLARAIPYLSLSPAAGQRDALIVDNLNTDRPAGVFCALGALVDDFAGADLDPAWKTYPADGAACAAGVQDGAVAVTLRQGSSDRCELYRSEGRVLADSQVAVEVVQAAPAGFATGLELWSARGDVVRWTLREGLAVAAAGPVYGQPVYAPPAVDAATARWLRLRVARGELHFELRDQGAVSWRDALVFPLPADLHLDPHTLTLFVERAGGSVPAEGVTVRLDSLNRP